MPALVISRNTLCLHGVLYASSLTFNYATFRCVHCSMALECYAAQLFANHCRQTRFHHRRSVFVMFCSLPLRHLAWRPCYANALERLLVDATCIGVWFQANLYFFYVACHWLYLQIRLSHCVRPETAIYRQDLRRRFRSCDEYNPWCKSWFYCSG